MMRYSPADNAHITRVPDPSTTGNRPDSWFSCAAPPFNQSPAVATFWLLPLSASTAGSETKDTKDEIRVESGKREYQLLEAWRVLPICRQGFSRSIPY